jgi:hypothetical protein
MSSRRYPPLGSTGFGGIRTRSSGTFAAKMSAVGMRMWLDVSRTMDEVAHAYDTAVWKFGRGHLDLNFPEIECRFKADMLASPSLIMTHTDQRRHRWEHQWLAIAEADEWAMEQRRTRFSEDVQAEFNFSRARREERREKIMRKVMSERLKIVCI